MRAGYPKPDSGPERAVDEPRESSVDGVSKQTGHGRPVQQHRTSEARLRLVAVAIGFAIAVGVGASGLLRKWGMSARTQDIVAFCSFVGAMLLMFAFPLIRSQWQRLATTTRVAEAAAAIGAVIVLVQGMHFVGVIRPPATPLNHAAIQIAQLRTELSRAGGAIKRDIALDFKGSGSRSRLFIITPPPSAISRGDTTDELRIYDRKGAGFALAFRYNPAGARCGADWEFRFRTLTDLDGDGRADVFANLQCASAGTRIDVPVSLRWAASSNKYELRPLIPEIPTFTRRTGNAYRAFRPTLIRNTKPLKFHDSDTNQSFRAIGVSDWRLVQSTDGPNRELVAAFEATRSRGFSEARQEVVIWRIAFSRGALSVGRCRLGNGQPSADYNGDLQLAPTRLIWEAGGSCSSRLPGGSPSDEPVAQFENSSESIIVMDDEHCHDVRDHIVCDFPDNPACQRIEMKIGSRIVQCLSRRRR